MSTLTFCPISPRKSSFVALIAACKLQLSPTERAASLPPAPCCQAPTTPTTPTTSTTATISTIPTMRPQPTAYRLLNDETSLRALLGALGVEIVTSSFTGRMQKRAWLDSVSSEVRCLCFFCQPSTSNCHLSTDQWRGGDSDSRPRAYEFDLAIRILRQIKLLGKILGNLALLRIQFLLYGNKAGYGCWTFTVNQSIVFIEG